MNDICFADITNEWTTLRMKTVDWNRLQACMGALQQRTSLPKIPSYALITYASLALERELANPSPHTPPQAPQLSLITPQAPIPSTPRSYSALDRANIAEFDIFWRMYPRKVAKPAALKAWLRASNRPSLEVVTQSLLWQIQHGDLSRELEFIPHASTWINQERWADEQAKPQTQLQKDEATLARALEKAAIIDTQRNQQR